MTTSIEIEAANRAMAEIAMGSKGSHRRDKELRYIWVPLSIALGRQAIPSALYWKANRLGEKFVGGTTDSPPRLVVWGVDPRGAWRRFIVIDHIDKDMPRIFRIIMTIINIIKVTLICTMGVSVSLIITAVYVLFAAAVFFLLRAHVF